ncbi:Sensor protein CitS [Pelotomaculum schinkii]|uniref:Sensor protein CitS n=1 Tax=Pelotomaculum schinkii TaxID=78350 RepID=A0A4Y7R8T8_9FIRM|nr:ATP-binding protein [Pelotomaculum schinkii]TEB05378.1 Sensor protein CitS [Pelotomaculum schinkii]
MNYLNENKAAFRIITFFLTQTFIILLAARVSNFYHKQIDLPDLFLTIIALSNFIIAIFIIKAFLNRDFLNNQISLYKNFTNETISMMRCERHDFINHLQVVYGLVFRKEHEAAKEYLNDIGINFRFNSQLLNLKNIYLRFLLQNKKNLAFENGITLTIDVKSSVENLNMASTDITTIFGNLIDNAIDVLKEITKEEKKIEIEIFETKNYYCFVIKDSGPRINIETIDFIFEKGFSTKGANRGYGLPLVRDIIQKYNGQVFYDDTHNKSFNITIPKR